MAKRKPKNRLVVGSNAWADSIPEWLLNTIKEDRLIAEMLGLVGSEVSSEDIGYAELVAYLMTASLKAPLTHEHTQIYLHCFTKLQDARNREIPNDLRVDELTSDQERELRSLRSMIFEKRGDIKIPLIEILRDMKDRRPPEGR